MFKEYTKNRFTTRDFKSELKVDFLQNDLSMQEETGAGQALILILRNIKFGA
ncbi:hypothetical protein LEP1GSC016_3762 [Leptospira borgpetersenii serovar Hardjo-bovis str. Sponselee]|uniref:Uncharacterized protein n=1 Tax=Leptospira borgpetersenii serovar Hardjo-bovis str. Sponselee TaxID=1303729 RepID=M6C3F4_LEPBO|nr:hypothetical protein LEP1GSC016_3762 [Leptospira borgpetersenii serovar Hardjo-bovis str. Sponselee]